MNKAQIKAELRRSACEDENPFRDVLGGALISAAYFSDWPRLAMRYQNQEDLRTFFLLVAEAL